jgi:hypothetical protein
MQKRLRLSVCCLFLLVLTGCGSSKDLSRGKAKDLIQNSQRFRNFDYRYNAVQLSPDQCGKLISSGVWKGGDTFNELTDKGRLLVESIYKGVNHSCTLIGNAKWTRHVVEVTGIADAPFGANVKEATFTWEWKYPDELKDDLGVLMGESFTYPLQLFDDGWRVIQ